MVPAERVMEVYAYLANTPPTAPGGKVDSTSVGETGDIQQHFRLPESRDWPEALLQRAYRESSPAMKAVLDILIEKAGKTVHSYEMIAAISKVRSKECNHHTLAGTVGAFGRRVANRYNRRLAHVYFLGCYSR
ncbi:MAG: hypothetical protein IPG67_06625 [Acidobacteria bacterium]|nr:hypothetical protein [Acidobacteriota bacterium]